MPRRVLMLLFPIRAVWSVAIVVATCWTASGQQQGTGSVSLTSFTTPYAQDFDTLASSGTSNVLPTAWYFNETLGNADMLYAAGTGSNSAGNTYSFGSTGSGERAFGGLQSSTLVPTVGASFTNNTGAVIAGLQVAYVGEQWRHGSADGNFDRLDFQYSTDATSLTTGTWTDFNALDFLTPNIIDPSGMLDGNAAQNRTALSGTITGLNIPDGATFWVRWSDFNVGGSDDGLAVDSFNITPTPVPEPGAVLGVAAAGLGLAGLVRRRYRGVPV